MLDEPKRLAGELIYSADERADRVEYKKRELYRDAVAKLLDELPRNQHFVIRLRENTEPWDARDDWTPPMRQWTPTLRYTIRVDIAPVETQRVVMPAPPDYASMSLMYLSQTAAQELRERAFWWWVGLARKVAAKLPRWGMR